MTDTPRRRRTTAAALAVGLVVLAASLPGLTAAQSAAPSPLPSTAAGASAGTQPTPVGQLTVALSAETESMDPALVYQNSGLSIINALFDPLLAIERDGTLSTGGLASGYQYVDDTHLLITLRSGITFHNGMPLTADDARFSLDRIRSDALASGWAGNYTSITSVDVVDPLTIQITLAHPDATLLRNLDTVQIVSRGYWDQVGDAGFATAPVGTGPFTFGEWVKDDHTTLNANPAYWAGSWKGWPLVQTVIFRVIPDAGTRVSELTTGGVDIIQDLSSDQLATLDGTGASPAYLDDAHHVELWIDTLGPDAGSAGVAAADLSPNQRTALEALAKPDVRVALNMAIDRQLVVDTLLGGYGVPMTHLFVSGDIGYDASIPVYPYDPEGARAMLAAAGYPNGFSVDLDVCTCDRQDTLQAAVAQLAAIGVTVTPKAYEITQFNAGWGPGKGSPLRASRLGFATDPNTYLQLWIRSGGYLSVYANPAADALVDQQATTLDPAARAAVLRQLGVLSHTDAPAVFLWSAGSLYGVRDGVSWQPHVIGYVPVFGTSVP